MRLGWTWRTLLALAGLLAVLPALAQPLPPRGIMPRQQDAMPGPMMGEAPGADMPGADPLQLLVNSYQVQRDLGLTPHQLVNLQLASRNFLTQMQELMAPRPGVRPEQVRAALDEQMARTRPMIARELTPEQLARLQQIMLQIEGPCAAVRDPGIAAQLGLAGQEAAQAAAACRERTMQMRTAFQPPAPGEDPCQVAARNRDRLMRIRAEGDAQLWALFSPPQRAEFARLEGREIALEPPMPPGCAPPGRAG